MTLNGIMTLCNHRLVRIEVSTAKILVSSQNRILHCELGRERNVCDTVPSSGCWEFSFTATAGRLPPSPQAPFCTLARSFLANSIPLTECQNGKEVHTMHCIVYIYHSAIPSIWYSKMFHFPNIWEKRILSFIRADVRLRWLGKKCAALHRKNWRLTDLGFFAQFA